VLRNHGGRLKTVSKRSHKLRWVLGTFALLLAGVYFLGPTLLAPILQRRLAAMVSEHLNAELAMDGLTYDFPYGLRAKNAALITRDEHGQNVDLVRVKELE